MQQEEKEKPVVKNYGVYFGALLVTDYRTGQKAIFNNLSKANSYAYEMNAVSGGYIVAEYYKKKKGEKHVTDNGK